MRSVSMSGAAARIAARLIPHALAATVIANAIVGASNPFWPAAGLFLFAPLIDLAAGEQGPLDHEFSAADRAVCLFAPWLWLPLHAGVLIAGLSVVRSTESYIVAGSLGISAGVFCGVFGMSAAHELMHVRTRPAQFSAAWLLASSGYGHFLIEHVHGHHRRVGTSADPASARLDESLYAFLPRAVLGGFASAWHFEALRLSRLRRSTMSLSNRILLLGLLTILLCSVAWLVAGAAGATFFVLQSAISITVLESINYIQHYGLERRQCTSAAPQPISAAHAWDCRFHVTNLLLLDLGRHPDHHIRPARRAGEAVRHDHAPRLPAGYFLMFMLALVPPLWKQFMNPRVVLFHEQFTRKFLRPS